MQRAGWKLGCFIFLAFFISVAARSQNQIIWPQAPQAQASGLLVNPVLGDVAQRGNQDPRWMSGQVAPMGYSNGPYPNLQKQPYAATVPSDHLAYPGQPPAKTIGATPWPYQQAVDRRDRGVLPRAPNPPHALVDQQLAQLASERKNAVVEADKQQEIVKKNQGAGKIFATVDLLYWQLRRRDLDYAVSSLPGAVVISGGEIHELEHPSDAGFRSMLGVELATGWQIGFGYTMYDSNTSDQAVDGAGTLYASRSHPDINRRAGVAAAESSFDLKILDLEVRNTLNLSDRADLSLFGGFRWAEIDQRFHVSYSEIEFPFGGTVTSVLDTQGFGLRIGADGKWAMTESLYLVGTGETSILFGDNDLTLEETQAGSGIVDVSDGYEQVLPVIATRVGVGYQKGPLQLEMGYEMQAWFDLGDRMGFLDDQHLGVFSHSNHNVLLDGYYFRLAWDR